MIAGCASSPPNTTAPSAQVNWPEGEHILTSLPSGWKVASTKSQNGVTISEYIPNGQTLDGWQELITIWVFRGASRFTVKNGFELVEKTYVAGCKTAPVVGRPDERIEQGLPIGVSAILCEQLKARPGSEGLVFKTIAGVDATYQVQRAWRLPPEQSSDLAIQKNRIDAAMPYLRTVLVCDTRVASRPCPPVAK